jgi:hypothetical protein
MGFHPSVANFKYNEKLGMKQQRGVMQGMFLKISY